MPKYYALNTAVSAVQCTTTTKAQQRDSSSAVTRGVI